MKNPQVISLSDPSFLLIMNNQDASTLKPVPQDLFGINPISNESSYAGIPSAVINQEDCNNTVFQNEICDISRESTLKQIKPTQYESSKMTRIKSKTPVFAQTA
jgi:Tfp pilus assembly protein PilZ